jgi:hypothetical protein
MAFVRDQRRVRRLVRVAAAACAPLCSACSPSGAAALYIHGAPCLTQGPSAKELSRDTTSFERARAEWSRADVSCRGKVGGGGDRGAEQWLG